jgi:predicted ATPase/DNA-binding winged helix-turn-helix (wHTH) protein
MLATNCGARWTSLLYYFTLRFINYYYECPVAHPADQAVSFGSFRLLPAQRLLLEADKPLRLGSRAFDILVALVENAGELVTKEELIARVWPNSLVEEGSLRVHMAALRRALGDGQAGKRFVATISGRGYRFVAPLAPVEGPRPGPSQPAGQELKHNLPALQTRMVGRAEIVASLVAALSQWRLMTLVGPGGIGKTTVALAVAEALIATYKDGVFFVDFAPLAEAHLVPSAVASALGLPSRSENQVPDLISFLANKNALLVLDCCEHVIATVASLAEKVLEGARGVHILATSREPLRAEGERLQRLSPLGLPVSSPALSAADALTYPAIQLFVERAAAIVDGFELSDADASFVADICRRLDGIPLAIELAASRIDAFGLRELAARLDDRFRLLTSGRRTALRRHQTLKATLDWSYDLLPEAERTILNRLAVFAGIFTLDSASAVVASPPLAASDAVDGIANLVAKSLVTAEIVDPGVHYRLLDTTHAYALEKLSESGEFNRVARRHAEHFRDFFQRAESEWETRPTAEWLAAYARQIDNLRAALNWAFSEGGDAGLGVELTVAALPMWFQLSLVDECRDRVERALAVLAGANQDERRKMKLYAALGWSLMYTTRPARESGAAWATALELAEKLDDADHRLRAIWGLWAGSQNNGEFRAALALAEQFRDLAAGSGNPSDVAVGDRMMGAALHFLGDQAAARRHIESMLGQYFTPDRRSDTVRFQFDQRVTARITLARILWLQGFADQAMREVEDNIESALSINHTLSLCNALAQAACPIALLVGDLPAAERFISLLLRHTEGHALGVWNAYGDCFKGELLIKRGDIDAGLRLSHAAVDKLRKARFVQYLTAFLGALAEGFASAGQVSQGLAVIDEALARCERYEERWCIAELLRIKGDLILRQHAPNAARAAEDHFLRSLDWALGQGALSWELRTSTSLARLRRQQGRLSEARDLLASVYGKFHECFETADLKAAKQLQDELA